MTWTPTQQTELLDLIRRRGERDALQQQLNTATTLLHERQQEQQQLSKKVADEQADVDRLERLSWATIYYNLLNRHGEQLTQEQAEAQRARLDYDAITGLVDSLTEQIASVQQRLTAYADVEAAYNERIASKKDYVKAQPGNAYDQYAVALTAAEKHRYELKEAELSGKVALRGTTRLVTLLDEAKSWGNWDIYGGGSTFSSMMKHNKLDEVRDQSERVRKKLQAFQSELGDVHQTMTANWNLDDNWTRFVDIFFDNIFTDTTVQQRIEQAYKKAQHLEFKLIDALRALVKQYEQGVVEHDQRTHDLRTYLEGAE